MANQSRQNRSWPLSREETLQLTKEMDHVIIAFTEISLRDCLSHDYTASDGGRSQFRRRVSSDPGDSETDSLHHVSSNDSEDVAERIGVIKTQVEDIIREGNQI